MESRQRDEIVKVQKPCEGMGEKGKKAVRCIYV